MEHRNDLVRRLMRPIAVIPPGVRRPDRMKQFIRPRPPAGLGSPRPNCASLSSSRRASGLGGCGCGSLVASSLVLVPSAAAAPPLWPAFAALSPLSPPRDVAQGGRDRVPVPITRTAFVSNGALVCLCSSPPQPP
jgi:hypothetical protein